MKRKELTRRIENGFEELAPDVFEAVMETLEQEEKYCSEAEEEIESILPDRKLFSFGKGFGKGFPKYAISVCAGFALICLWIFAGLGMNKETVYLVLDINPSIQIELDESFQVTQLKGLNQDGKEVAKMLEWKKDEPVRDLLDVLLSNVVERSYLKSSGAILVTLSASDESVCGNLERVVKDGMKEKLTELNVSGVTVAYWRADHIAGEEGRKILEEELERQCGLPGEEVREMSVAELISYCRENLETTLTVSEMETAEDFSVKEEVKNDAETNKSEENFPNKESGQEDGANMENMEKDTQESTEESTEEDDSKEDIKYEETEENQNIQNSNTDLPPQSEAPVQNENSAQEQQCDPPAPNVTSASNQEDKEKKKKKQKKKKKEKQKEKEKKKENHKQKENEKKKEKEKKKENQKQKEKEKKEENKKKKENQKKCKNKKQTPKTQKVVTDKPDTEKSGTEKTGAKKDGAEKSGTEKTGAKKDGAEKSGTEKTGA